MWTAVDFETTGLLLHPVVPVERQPRAIEFAAVREDGEERVWLFNPEQPIGPEITRITGLTTADVSGAPRFPAVWPEIAAFLTEEVWAHNATFDHGILDAELARAKLPPVTARWWCTVEEFAPEWGRRPRLVELYEWMFGEPFAQEHRALSDTRALAAIVRAFKGCG
jgi:DNA polymerase III epsilon subunit-like protein